jgi:hypothetical protein
MTQRPVPKSCRALLAAPTAPPERAAVKVAALGVLIERTAVKVPALYDRMGYTWIDPNGRVVTDNIGENLDWYVDRGYVRERMDVARIVDGSFDEGAVAQQGRFESRSDPR